MKKTATKQGTRRSLGISAFPIIILCFILAMVIYHFVYGNPANFINNDPNNHPIQGNLLGTIYKGGDHRSGYPDLVIYGIDFKRGAVDCLKKSEREEEFATIRDEGEE